MEVRCNLHCGGLGENVNAGRQPPFHDCPERKKRKREWRERLDVLVEMKWRGLRGKREKKSNTSQQLFIYWNWALHCQDSRSKLKGKDIWWEFKKRKRDGKLNFITTFTLPPFPERGAVKEVIYIYGKRTVAIFHDTWLIDGISSACS